ncbi:MAG: 4Fe-4S dicluster domain-containing protein [Vicinamibacterales bacterium]
MTHRFFVQLHRCVGCGSCVMACRLENGWPSGAGWRRVLPLNLARRAGGPTYHLSLACHHCELPACLRACPSGAYEKRPDGIVAHREEVCIGCRYCEMACPFGAPQYDETKRIVRKCDLCAHRVDEGRLPACVEACPTGALSITDTPAAEDRESVPGFADIGGCRPRTRFRPPAGARRHMLFAALEERLSKSRAE